MTKVNKKRFGDTFQQENKDFGISNAYSIFSDNDCRNKGWFFVRTYFSSDNIRRQHVCCTRTLFHSVEFFQLQFVILLSKQVTQTTKHNALNSIQALTTANYSNGVIQRNSIGFACKHWKMSYIFHIKLLFF